MRNFDIDLCLDLFDKKMDALAEEQSKNAPNRAYPNCKGCFANKQYLCGILTQSYEKNCPFKKRKIDFDKDYTRLLKKLKKDNAGNQIEIRPLSLEREIK